MPAGCRAPPGLFCVAALLPVSVDPWGESDRSGVSGLAFPPACLVYISSHGGPSVFSDRPSKHGLGAAEGPRCEDRTKRTRHEGRGTKRHVPFFNFIYAYASAVARAAAGHG